MIVNRVTGQHAWFTEELLGTPQGPGYLPMYVTAGTPVFALLLFPLSQGPEIEVPVADNSARPRSQPISFWYARSSLADSYSPEAFFWRQSTKE